MTMGSSTGSLKTSLEVFPGTPAPYIYTPSIYSETTFWHTRSHALLWFGKGRVLKKKTLKKTLLYNYIYIYQCYLQQFRTTRRKIHQKSQNLEKSIRRNMGNHQKTFLVQFYQYYIDLNKVSVVSCCWFDWIIFLALLVVCPF